MPRGVVVGEHGGLSGGKGVEPDAEHERRALGHLLLYHHSWGWHGVAVVAADDTHLYVVLAVVCEREVAALELLVSVVLPAVPLPAAAPRLHEQVPVVAVV